MSTVKKAITVKNHSSVSSSIMNITITDLSITAMDKKFIHRLIYMIIMSNLNTTRDLSSMPSKKQDISKLRIIIKINGNKISKILTRYKKAIGK